MVFLFAGTSHKEVQHDPPSSKKQPHTSSATITPPASSQDSAENNIIEGNIKLPKDDAQRKKFKEEYNDPETQENTRLNALLYHTSDETVDMYKMENNSSDLLGRLYFDDYDSDSVASQSVTPLLSPNVTGGNNIGGVLSPGGGKPTSDYFQHMLGTIGSASIHSTSSVSSPKPRPTMVTRKSFERGVSFDTMTDDHRKSLTFKLKHPEFKFRRNNKTLLSGYNGDSESLKAIQWLFDEMIVNGDTIIILQVLDEKHFDKIDKREANRALGKIESLNAHGKKIRFVFELVIGKPQKLLKDAIAEFNPQMMVIGTHHYDDYPSSSSKSFLSKSSFSKHFLECALVPVIVVKPTYEHVEYLPKPVDSETYFQELVTKIDHNRHPETQSHSHRKISRKILSPTSSRTSSYTNLASLAAPKHHNLENERLRENQTFAGVDSDRGRSLENPDDESSRTRNSGSGSRSRSRSRTRLSKLFHHSH